MLIISRDKRLEEEFNKTIRLKHEKQEDFNPTVKHATDFVYCLRKAYFRLKNYPSDLPEGAEHILEVGKTHHLLYQVLRNAIKEYEVKYGEIVGHIDMFRGVPIEFKSTRKWAYDDPTVETLNPNYIRQLGFYCLFSGIPEGKLVILPIIKPRIICFHIKFTPEELKQFEKELKEENELLDKALKTDNIDLIPPKPRYKWECEMCAYRKYCKALSKPELLEEEELEELLPIFEEE